MKIQRVLFGILPLSLLIVSNTVYSHEYDGTIEPMVVSTMHFGSNASFNTPIEYVVKTGTFIEPEVLDGNGKIIQKGTVLAQLDVTYWKAMADAYRSEIVSKEQDLITAKANYERENSLVQSRTVSVEEYQQVKADYYDTINNLNNARFSLIETEQIIKAYTLKAPFEGVVDKVFITHGLASGIPQVVQVTQLNPVKVSIPMDRSEANKIMSFTKVTITGEFNSKPIDVIYGSGMLTDKGISFLVFNDKIYNGTKEYNGKQVPILTDFLPVCNFQDYPNSNFVGAAFECIFSEHGKNFIWKIDPINEGFFKVKKIYIDKKSTERISSIGTIFAVPKSKGLKENDSLLTNYPKSLKDGDIVFCSTQRYEFMPGDKVNVSIGINDNSDNGDKNNNNT